jgi:hypothetical protein
MYSKTKNPTHLEESMSYAETLESLISIGSHPKQYALLKRMQGRNFWYQATSIDIDDSQKIGDLKRAIETTEICFKIFTRTENIPEYSQALFYMAKDYIDLYQLTQNPLDLTNAEMHIKTLFSLYEDKLLNEDVNYTNGKNLELEIVLEKAKTL